ncbi:hypothetical protein A616_17100 [Brevibacillus brevis X23]|nr:hypothetical protein A616_17100 [Brevibacillus brevis X23]
MINIYRASNGHYLEDDKGQWYHKNVFQSMWAGSDKPDFQLTELERESPEYQKLLGTFKLEMNDLFKQL